MKVLRKNWTYESWLNDEISVEGKSLWYILHHSAIYKMKSPDLTTWEWYSIASTELTIIQSKQQETWNKAIDYNLESYKKYIRDHTEQKFMVSDKAEFIASEISLIQDLINQNKVVYNNMLKSYNTAHSNILGSDFLKLGSKIEKGFCPIPIIGGPDYFELNIPKEEQLFFSLYLAKKRLDFLLSIRNEVEQSIQYKDYKDLYNALDKVFDINCRLVDFNKAMNRQIKSPKDRIIWFTKLKTDAVFFADHFGFSIKELNNNFVHKDDKPYQRGNKYNPLTKNRFRTLIKRFK